MKNFKKKKRENRINLENVIKQVEVASFQVEFEIEGGEVLDKSSTISVIRDRLPRIVDLRPRYCRRDENLFRVGHAAPDTPACVVTPEW